MTGDGGDGRRLDVSASEFRALVDAVSTGAAGTSGPRG
jgi:hypothetical protein